MRRVWRTVQPALCGAALVLLFAALFGPVGAGVVLAVYVGMHAIIANGGEW